MPAYDGVYKYTRNGRNNGCTSAPRDDKIDPPKEASERRRLRLSFGECCRMSCRASVRRSRPRRPPAREGGSAALLYRNRPAIVR